MLNDIDIDEFVGVQRFSEYAYPLVDKSVHSVMELYVLDIRLRALLIKAFSIIEIGLVSQLGKFGLASKFSSFGAARRALASLTNPQQFRIARKFGFQNQKEMKSCLIHLNHLRNRAAHHERVWNCQNKFSMPLMVKTDFADKYGFPKNLFVMAASLNLLISILKSFPPFIEFEKEFSALITSTSLEPQFLLQNMGFEVP